MIPLFVHITTTGEIWVSSQKEDSPAALLTTFRVNSGTGLVKLVKLTGSGNASAVALASTLTTSTGKEVENIRTKS
jgi:hypothetical protein